VVCMYIHKNHYQNWGKRITQSIEMFQRLVALL
jgi:hypothetical protein